jgi:hypothetical protein
VKHPLDGRGVRRIFLRQFSTSVDSRSAAGDDVASAIAGSGGAAVARLDTVPDSRLATTMMLRTCVTGPLAELGISWHLPDQGFDQIFPGCHRAYRKLAHFWGGYTLRVIVEGCT